MAQIRERGEVLRDLGDGLVLRRSTRADADALAEFNGALHGNHETGEPEHGVAAWTRDLLTRSHPTFGPEDFTIVEEAATGRIVSTLNLISQTWSYDGIPFGVGRPEIVGTLEEFRGRGLVRAQFEVIHGWSAERGELAQGITGIPFFYRQFGYEMGLDLGGGCEGFEQGVPALAGAEQEPYRIRQAVGGDLPFLMDTYERGCRRSLVSCVHDKASWRYTLCGRSQVSVNATVIRVIEAADGTPVGLLGYGGSLWGTSVGVVLYELRSGVSYAAVTPSVLRHLCAVGREYAASKPGGRFTSYQFAFGHEHPVYAVAADHLSPPRGFYAWYLRVPDVPGFLRHIAPVLERRMAVSPLAGHTGDLRVSFYRSGLHLRFEDGRLACAEPWQPVPHAGGDAGFPDLTFLQLLFGYRSLAELRYAFADCYASGLAALLLDALFPKRHSCVWPMS